MKHFGDIAIAIGMSDEYRCVIAIVLVSSCIVLSIARILM